MKEFDKVNPNNKLKMVVVSDEGVEILRLTKNEYL